MAFQKKRAELQVERTWVRNPRENGGYEYELRQVHMPEVYRARPDDISPPYAMRHTLEAAGMHRAAAMEPNPYAHVADGVLSWKEQLAEKEFFHQTVSRFDAAVEHRQRYLDNGVFKYTPALI